MRLGFSSYACAWAIGVPGFPNPRPMNAHGLLERTAELGLSVLQVADNLPLDRMPPGDLREFVGRARAMGIDVEVGTRGIAPSHLARYLAIAGEAGSPILRIVVDTADHKPAEEEIVRTLRTIAPAFDRAGVTLAIENHDRFKAKDLAAIIERINSPRVGVCLDTTNSFAALEGPEVVVSTLGSLVVNLHIKEFTIRRLEHNLGFVVEGCPAGQGMLNVPWLLDSLRALGREPNAILELWPPPEPELDATLAKEAAWAEESVKYLRRFISA